MRKPQVELPANRFGSQLLSVKPRLMLQMLGLTAGLTLSAWGYAVGLGGINVVSALGQPLKAEIELVAVDKADKPSLVARLASPDAYKGAGLEYPYGVKYSFQIESRANGEPYLRLSSNQQINDPFVSLLVELSWSSGKLMREYTFLLDPPGYVAAQPKAAAVQPVAPAPSAAPAPSVAPAAVQSVPLEAAKEPEAVKPVAKPVVARAVEKPLPAADSERVATGTIVVKRGDSLNKIAAQIKPGEISLDRMLVALYRANADQFDGKNMNRIKSGKILRMPDQDELMNVGQSEATQEIHAQAADWNAYRQKLAGAASASHASEATQQVVTGKISAPAADKTPVANESAREVLRLSKGEAPGDKAGGAGKSARDNAAAEDAIAKAKAVEEEKTRAALLEANLKNMQRLAQLKSEAAALAAGASSVAVASEVSAVSEVSAASEVAAVSEVAATSHVAASSAVKAAPAEVEAPSFIDVLMENPAALGIGAAALLAVGGLGVALRRRKATAVDNDADEVGAATVSHLTSPVVPSPDTGDFTAIVSPVEEVAQLPDDVDPISEADLFLNFGRDEQAEEVLKDALVRTPDNHQLHLKLLGIYASRQDAAAFAQLASQLQESGDADAMQQAAAMGRKLDPSNPLYGAEASIEDADSATMLTAALHAEETPPMAPDMDSAADERAQDELIDFDVTATPPEQKAAVDFDVTSTSPSMTVPDVLDFDITSSALATPEEAHHEDEALPNLDDLIFDVMSAPSSRDKDEMTEPPVSPAEQPADDGMEFMLDFPMDEVAEKTAPHPAIDLSDISLDMDDVAAPAAPDASAPVAEVASEHWHEVATKLDLARAYQEMGDEVGAREILDEVLQEGDEAQQQEAQLLIKQLG